MEQWWIHAIGLALTIIGALILAVAALAWRTVLKIEKKQDIQLQTEADCRSNLPKTYASWDALLGPEGVLTVIRKDRIDKWHDYDRHRHNSSPEGISGPPIKI